MPLAASTTRRFCHWSRLKAQPEFPESELAVSRFGPKNVGAPVTPHIFKKTPSPPPASRLFRLLNGTPRVGYPGLMIRPVSQGHLLPADLTLLDRSPRRLNQRWQVPALRRRALRGHWPRPARQPLYDKGLHNATLLPRPLFVGR